MPEPFLETPPKTLNTRDNPLDYALVTTMSSENM